VQTAAFRFVNQVPLTSWRFLQSTFVWPNHQLTALQLSDWMICANLTT
jgi:hypothetical protein